MPNKSINSPKPQSKMGGYMRCYLMMGWATPDDVAAHVAKLKRHDEQQAAKKS